MRLEESLAFVLSILPIAISAPTEPLTSRQTSSVPSFVLDYAPLIYLDSSEFYFPSDIAAQLDHTQPEIDFIPVSNAPSPLTLSNLDSLNGLGGSSIHLTSVDDITTDPAWLNGVRPEPPTPGATACAIVVVPRSDTATDVFYFYFYAFNQGNTVLGQEFGDHVGDWEHIMIRFSDSTPQSIWYSQHSSGEAFTYKAVQKSGARPVGYSARGTHATYATPGTHDHTIPGVNLPAGPLEDHTSAGTLWDPSLNAFVYSYDPEAGTFTAYNGEDPTAWLNYDGRWGDEQYPSDDPRQVEFLGIDEFAKYTSGPNGPKFKGLTRDKVCPDDEDLCIVRPVLTVK